MIKITTTGSFSKTEKFLNKTKKYNYKKVLEKYAEQGVRALRDATPIDSGETASSWRYKIKMDNNSYRIEWYNTNVNDGVSIAVILQYGHATRNGSYVEGIDYINPALKPVFDNLAKEVWKEVSK